MRKRTITFLVGLLVAVLLVLLRGPRRQPTAAGDAAAGSERDAGPRGRVVVTVYDEGAPIAERWVVFHDADGEVLDARRSGVDGKAAGEVPRGGMITVAHGDSLHALLTFSGVEPGDAIVVGEKDEEEGVATTAFAARITPPGPLAGAARYTVSLGVGETALPDPAAPVELPVLSRFVEKDGRFKVLAEALDATGEPLAFAFARAPAPPDAGAARAAEVRLGAWTRAWRPLDLVLVHPPSGSVAEAKLSIFAKDEDRFDRRPRRVELGAATARVTFPVPPGLGTEGRIELAVTRDGSRRTIVRREASLSPVTTIDLGATLLPSVTAVRLEPTGAPDRPAIAWDVDGDPAGADAAIAHASWPATREHVWTVVAPPGARRVRLPALPPELAAWRPDGRPIAPGATLVEASFYEGFADVRRMGIARLGEHEEEHEDEDEHEEDEKGATTVRTSSAGDLEP